MTDPNVVIIDPNDNYPVILDYEGKLPSGTSINAATITVTEAKTGTLTPDIIDGSPTIVSGNKIKFTLDGSEGTNPGDYIVAITAGLTPAGSLGDNFYLKIRSAF